MKKNIRNFLRLGVCQSTLYPALLECDQGFVEAFETLCADPDFEVIELGGPRDARLWIETARIIAGRDIELIYHATVDLYREWVFPISPEPRQRKRALEIGLNLVERSAKRGFCGIIFPNGPAPQPEDWDISMDRLADYFIRLSQRAEECSPGLRVAMEILDNNPIAKGFMIGRSADAARLATRIRQATGNFSLCFDLAHMPLIGETPAQALSVCKDFVDFVHLGNCVLKGKSPFLGDKHPPFGVPHGRIGKAELTSFFQEAIDCGLLCEKRRPSVSIEIITPSGHDPVRILKRAKGIIQEAWQEA